MDTQLIRQLCVESKIIIRRFGMENNKKEDMVFVSFDRLWDNFKKYWWIAAVLGLSIIEAFVLLRAGCAIGFVSSQIRFGSFL